MGSKVKPPSEVTLNNLFVFPTLEFPDASKTPRYLSPAPPRKIGLNWLVVKFSLFPTWYVFKSVLGVSEGFPGRDPS